VGVLTLPSPWLAIGAVADHANQAHLAAGTLKRRYTVGVGLRPLAMAHAKSGPQFTLTGDVLLNGDHGLGDADYRLGLAFEPAPGAAARCSGRSRPWRPSRSTGSSSTRSTTG